MPLEQGFVQVYTGNGKSKTTATIGQAVRALGSQLKVLLVQFMKDYPYGEVTVLENLSPHLKLRRYGNDSFVFQKRPPSQDLKDQVKQGLDQALADMRGGLFDVVILDEVCVSVYFGLLSEEEVMAFIKQKPHQVELILTGRYCPKGILDAADLVTEMKEIKHYYQQGILARKGIES